MKLLPPWRVTNLHKDSPIWPHSYPRKCIYFSSKMSLINNLLVFYFPYCFKFLISPFCLCPLKISVQQIHHQRWQLRRLALPTCVSTALEGTPYASGNNSFPTPIKSSASPWRLQGGCQLKSIVPVVCVAGTAARGAEQGSRAALLCAVFRGSHRWGSSTDPSQISSTAEWGQELQLGQRGGLWSTAQLSCDLLPLPTVSLL